jgi:hypothetical protein
MRSAAESNLVAPVSKEYMLKMKRKRGMGKSWRGLWPSSFGLWRKNEMWLNTRLGKWGGMRK